jgi:Na+-transporting NADH:ubiquinone oxidoreductase subunit A
MIKIKRGLDLPIAGSPTQSIENASNVSTVAVLGPDYVGLKPTMMVREGDSVKRGQKLFEDKKNPGVFFTAPAAGVVKEINRGAKRALLSVVIELGEDQAETFESFAADKLSGLDSDIVRQQLIQSGLWTAIRTRPFNKAPAVDSSAKAIIVTAIDTHPLAANPEVVIQENEAAFKAGVEVLNCMTDGDVFVTKAPNAKVPDVGNVQEFDGPHPAGLAGTHIHYLAPASEKNVTWFLNYQDAIAIGKLFLEGQVSPERVIALGGPQVKNPRLIKTVVGANLSEITSNELKDGENRLVSGSVLGGRTASDATAYLGRFHLQVSVLEEGREREFMHYMRAGVNKHSVLNIFWSKLSSGKLFNYTTSTNGSDRAMVPVGQYEKVMPLDILPTQLLRAILVQDTDTAQKLGVLELDEEDVALCTYVCPGKYEYGPLLRDNLTLIEKEG